MLGLSAEFSSCSDSSGLGFRRITPGKEEFLGSPVCDVGVAGALNQQGASWAIQVYCPAFWLGSSRGFLLLGSCSCHAKTHVSPSFLTLFQFIMCGIV